MAIERRFLPLPCNLETRADGVDVLSGYGAVYYDGTPGTEFELWGDMFEQFLPGAFADVASQDVRCFFNHDPSLILGRNTAGTLALAVDARGLKYDCQLPDSPNGKNVGVAVQRKDITGSSIGMVVLQETFSQVERDGRQVVLRQIGKVELSDVSPVTFPAYKATAAEIRSLTDRAASVLPVNRSREFRRLQLQGLDH